MRIKFTGDLDPKTLGLLIIKELARMKLNSFYSANLYIGSDNKVVEIKAESLHTGISKGPDPMKNGKPKTQWSKRQVGGKRPQKNVALVNSWEPKLGAIQPADAIDLSSDELPF